MPYSTVQKRVLGVDYIQQIVCSAASEDVAEAAVEEIESILRASKKIPDGGEAAFEVRTQHGEGCAGLVAQQGFRRYSYEVQYIHINNRYL